MSSQGPFGALEREPPQPLSTTRRAKKSVNGLAVVVAQVPGAQMVPRAETWPATIGWTASTRQCLGKTFIDAAYLTRPLENRSSVDKRCDGANGDLWRELRQARLLQGNAFAQKVPSHVSISDVASGKLTIEAYIPSSVADCAAAVAADQAQPPKALAKEHERW